MAEQEHRGAALVTGASYGIGAAAAIALAQQGFDVAVTDLRAEDATETVKAIEAAGGRGIALPLDVQSQESIQRTFRAALDAFGGLDVLVNNAGVPSPGKPALEITRADWEFVVGINLSGTFFMAQA